MKKPFLGLVSVLAMAVQAAEPPAVAFPEGYRDWRHVKSMELKPAHPLYESFGGIHHLYANPKAVQGYRNGRFPDGATIVFDLLEAQNGVNAMTEGKRKVLGVMVRDASRHGATGGWGFEAFAGGDPKKPVVGRDAAKACFGCHATRQDSNYLFSSLRD
ncbi:MAG: cytochrome P460 family protein [Pseudomonadota bacterium]